MKAYFAYLWEMLKQFFSDLGQFFYKGIVSPWTDLKTNFDNYQQVFDTYRADFGFGGWLMYILFLLLIIAALGAAGFGLFILIKRYVKFAKTEVDKDELKRQVARLNIELYDLSREKEKILGLQLQSLAGKKLPTVDENAPEGESTNEIISESASRFPRLVHVDNIYATKDVNVPEVEGLTLELLCEQFRNYAASQHGIYYTITTIRQMFAGMGAAKLIILEGISGTGKTSMPLELGRFFKHDAKICPVQPNWKDRSELLGYYNEFTKKFNATEFLEALYTSLYRKDTNLIVLDEMNLARVEYYFAEFLSVMENPDPDNWNIELIGNIDTYDPKLFNNGKIKVPQNVVFFGTANNDDSTFTISDKVYDRAISLFFDNKGIPFESEYQEAVEVPYSQLQRLYQEALEEHKIEDDNVNLKKFEELDTFVIKKFRLAFGNRIMKQLRQFVPIYVACGGDELDGFDFIFTNKILKKFESLNIAFLKNELTELQRMLEKLFGKGTFPMANKFIDNLLKMN